MNFTDLSFILLLLPLIILIHSILNNSYQKAFLCLSCVLFYFYCEPFYAFLLYFLIFITYIYTRLLKRLQYKKISLFIYVTFVIGILTYFKYTNFIISTFNSLFQSEISLISLIMPLGISFYIFQSIGYVVDVVQGKIEAEKNLYNLVIFLSFFPTIASGPILRYSNFIHQLENRKISPDNLSLGLRRFIIGLTKKVLMSNQLAIIANYSFDHIQNLGWFMAWGGAICYMMQIYLDFSGYSDMAIGIGNMLGFTIPENFNEPYSALTISDFWRRWHISLSSWFKDYIYIPLGGNRVSRNRWVMNITIVWACTGIWHGANWTFVLWGLYFGVLLILEKQILYKIYQKLPKWGSHVFVLFMVLLSWIIFRSADFHELILYLTELFNFKKGISLMELKYLDLLYLYPIVILSVFLCTDLASKLYHWFNSKRYGGYLLDVGLIICLLLNIMILVNSSYSPFIYFNF